MLERMHTDSIPILAGDPICAKWVDIGCRAAVRHEDTALSDVVLSCAMLNASMAHPDAGTRGDLYHSCLPIYNKALAVFRRELDKEMTAEQQESAALTAYFCHTIEIAANASWAQSCKHGDGLGLILACRGPEALQSSTIRSLFCEYRIVNLGHNLLQGQTTFLEQQEWLQPTWRSQHPQMNNSYHTLLDVSLKLPGMVEAFNNATAEQHPDLNALHTLLDRLDVIEIEVEAWQRSLALKLAKSSTDANAPYVPAMELEGALVLKHLTVLHRNALLSKIYPLLNLGSTRAFTRQIYACLDSICAAMDFFFQPDVRIAGRVIYVSFLLVALGGLPSTATDASSDVFDAKVVQTACGNCALAIERLESAGFTPWDVVRDRWEYMKKFHPDRQMGVIRWDGGSEMAEHSGRGISVRS